jgi:hypothetical protein
MDASCPEPSEGELRLQGASLSYGNGAL